MSKHKLLGLAATVAAGALALSGCTPTAQTGTSASAGQTGGTATVAWNQGFFSYNIDTADGNATANSNIQYIANDRMGYYDKDLKVAQNASFGKYEKVSDSPLTIKYTLADTAQWSDGTPVTADDLILEWAANSSNFNTYEAKTDEDGAVAGANTGTNVFFNASQIGFKLITDFPTVGDNGKSVTFTYSKPYVDWETIAMVPTGVPAHIVGKKALGLSDNAAAAAAVTTAIKSKDNASLAKISNFWNTGFAFKNTPADKDLLVGSGPYTITDLKEEDHVTLTKNPNYKGSHVGGVDKIVVRIIPDAQASVQALQNGEVLVTQPQATADIFKQVKALSNVNVATADGGTYEHVDLVFNNGGPFDPKTYGGDAAKALKVRQAFLTAIPRQKIVDNIIKPLNPSAVIRQSFNAVPGSALYDTVSKANGLEAAYGGGDSAKAATILKEAGLATAPTVRMMFASTNTRRQQEFQLIKESAEAAGFKVEDKSSKDWGKLLQVTTQYDASLFGWQSTSLAVAEANNEFKSTGQNNYGKYNNADVDKLLDQLMVSTDSAKQAELLSGVEAHLVKDAFGTTIFQFPEITSSSKKIQNVSSIALSPNYFWNFWEWKLS